MRCERETRSMLQSTKFPAPSGAHHLANVAACIMQVADAPQLTAFATESPNPHSSMGTIGGTDSSSHIWLTSVQSRRIHRRTVPENFRPCRATTMRRDENEMQLNPARHNNEFMKRDLLVTAKLSLDCHGDYLCAETSVRLSREGHMPEF